MKKKLIKSHQKLFRYLITNLIVMLLSISIVLNLIYIPKFFQEQKQNNDHYISIEIKLEAPEKDGETNQLLADNFYQTCASTLGQLMRENKQIFVVETKQFGSILLTMNYFNIKNHSFETIKTDFINSYFSTQVKNEQGNFINTTGIDLTPLQDNNVFQIIKVNLNSP